MLKKLAVNLVLAILAMNDVWAQDADTVQTQVAGLAECRNEQLIGHSIPRRLAEAEVAAHRLFPAYSIDYPYGTQLKSGWGFSLTLLIDETGAINCYKASISASEPVTLADGRLAFFHGLSNKRYEPFLEDGKAVPMIIEEYVAEQELPQAHVPLPSVPLAQVHLTLERSGCFGSCPAYKVEVFGDGRVVYEGFGYVDVMGRHDWKIPTTEVAALVESLRRNDIWSLRGRYMGLMTDQPTFTVKLGMGSQSRTIEDYVGESAGMPRVVADFENEIDQISRVKGWINLSQEAVIRLQEERFDFKSRKGSELLARAIENDQSHDDAAMMSLINLGTSIQMISMMHDWSHQNDESLINVALRHQRAILIEPLIRRGALQVNGKLDKRKLDSAFRSAIAGGRFDLVRQIWDVGGEKMHPSLIFNDIGEDKRHHRKSSVILLLSHHSYDEGKWDGLQIAQWLIEKGCDMKATAVDGRTLLHIAADAGDAKFVRYLLDQGFDPSTRGRYGLPALGGAQDEEVAMLLLEVGTNFSFMDDDGHQFRRYAEYNHWGRVINWLDAHHQ